MKFEEDPDEDFWQPANEIEMIEDVDLEDDLLFNTKQDDLNL